MEIFIYIITALLCVSVLLGIAILIKLKKPSSDGGMQAVTDEVKALGTKTDILMKNTGDEFSRVRGEIGNVTETVNAKLADVTKANYEGQVSLTNLVKNSLNEMSEANEKRNSHLAETLERSVERMTQSNEKKLEEMRATVDEKLTATLTSRLDSSFKTVSERLESVYKSLGEMKELSGGVTALNRLFTNVKTRGTWAEYQLGALLDQIIPNMYVKNYKAKDGAGIVEFAVKIPSADSKKITYMPVDSKFPTEDYGRLCDASSSGDAAAVLEARKALEHRVIDEAKTVSKYINEPETTPFAVMYLATEGLYAEIASSQNGLLEKIQREYSVLIAGPSTVTALLSSLAVGFRTAAINEKAGEIRDILAAVKKQYADFDSVLHSVKKKLESADAEIDKAVKRNELINKKLKSVGEIDAEKAENLLSDGE